MLRAIFGFDHCASTPAPAPSKVSVPFLLGLGYPASTIRPDLLAVDTSGFVGGYSAFILGHGGDESSLSLYMNGAFPTPPTNITIGFRLKTLQAGKLTGSVIALTWPGNVDPKAYSLFDTTRANNPWLPTAGNECYVELTYDVVTRISTAIVDGAPVTLTSPSGLTSAQQISLAAAFAAGTWGIAFRLSDASSTRYAIRDVYVLDSVPGDGYTLPIGAQRLYMVYPDSASGSGWTSSTGQELTDTLNVPLPAIADIASPTDKTPLQLSMTTATPRGMRINAVSLILSATSNGVSNIPNKLEISQGQSTFPTEFINVTPDGSYNKPIGLFTKAPDGGVWDSSKIDELAITLTPDTSA